MMDLVFIKSPIVSGIIWHLMAFYGNGTMVSSLKEKHK
jgi:ABC-type sulfate transport system permease subunit